VLLGLLKDSDTRVQATAIAALCEIQQDEEAVAAALCVLKSGSDTDRASLLYLLQGFRPPALIPVVIGLIQSGAGGYDLS
jgi:HEAT repeat protein